MVCVVHYDLFGLFSLYPYRRHTYTVNKQQQQQPVLMDFDQVWIPRPGTDPNTNTYYPYPTILVDDYEDDDDDAYWSEVRNADDESDNGNCGAMSSDNHPVVHPADRGTCFANAAHGNFDQKPKSADINRVSITPPFSNFEDEYNNSGEDDDNYTAPGEERDENVF